jgi:hypothetical protein
MPIIDNRILIDNADALDPAGDGIWEDDAGNFMNPNLSQVGSGAETFIEGTAAISERVSGTSGETGLLFNTEVVNDWSNNVFYLWINMVQTGVLRDRAAGGMTMRFTGATVTNWFEVNIAGGDTYGGGWTMFVVDIEDAWARPDLTNGTVPTPNAIQRVGAVFRSDTIAPGATDNLALDAMWRLPRGRPGIVVSGTNAGVPYSILDILDAGDNGDTAKAWGTLERLKNGTLSLNTSIQVGGPFGSPEVGLGSPDTTFLDTNEVLGWENQRVIDGFYNISTSAGSPTTVSFTLGVKTGTGDDATGAQGFVITAADRQLTFGSPLFERIRWNIDFGNPNVDLSALYGCSLIGGYIFTLDSPNVEVISTLYIDSAQAFVSESTQLRNQVVEAAPRFQIVRFGSPVTAGSPRTPFGSPIANDLSFMVTNDISDLKFCTFGFSEKHAIELTGAFGSPPLSGSPLLPPVQSSVGNRFIGYGADETQDAAIHNSFGKDITINLTEGASIGEHTQHNVGSPVFITLVASVTITVTVLDTAGNPIETAQTAIYRDSDEFQIMNQDTNASGVATTGFGGSTPVAVSIRVRKNSPGDTRYFPVNAPATITGSGLTVTITLIEDEIAT